MFVVQPKALCQIVFFSFHRLFTAQLMYGSTMIKPIWLNFFYIVIKVKRTHEKSLHRMQAKGNLSRPELKFDTVVAGTTGFTHLSRLVPGQKDDLWDASNEVPRRGQRSRHFTPVIIKDRVSNVKSLSTQFYTFHTLRRGPWHYLRLTVNRYKNNIVEQLTLHLTSGKREDPEG